MDNAHRQSAEKEEEEIDLRSWESDQRSPSPPAFPLLCHDTLIDVFRFFDRRALSRAVEPLCSRFRALFASGRLFAVYPTKQFEWLSFRNEALFSNRPSLIVRAYSACPNKGNYGPASGCGSIVPGELVMPLDHPLLAAGQAPPPEYVRATRVRIGMDATVDVAKRTHQRSVCTLDRRYVAVIEQFAGAFVGAVLFLHQEQLLSAMMSSAFFPRILALFRGISYQGSVAIARQPSLLPNLLIHCRVLRFGEDEERRGIYFGIIQSPTFDFDREDIVSWLNQPFSAPKDKGKERILCIVQKQAWLSDLAKRLIARFTTAEVAQPYTLYITNRTDSNNLAQHTTDEEVLAHNERTGERLLRCTPARGISLLAQYPSTDSELYGMVPLTNIGAVFSRHSVKQPGEAPTFKSAH